MKRNINQTRKEETMLVTSENKSKEISLNDVAELMDIQKIIKVIRNIKHQTIIIVIYGTGFRLGETINLRVRGF